MTGGRSVSDGSEGPPSKYGQAHRSPGLEVASARAGVRDGAQHPTKGVCVHVGVRVYVCVRILGLMLWSIPLDWPCAMERSVVVTDVREVLLTRVRA